MMLDQVSLRRFEAQCTQESPPQCRVACPFGLDCRSFLASMAKGNLAEGRKVLERHVPLTGIMALLCDHPCEEVCLRRDFGGSIALHSLEQTCILQTQSQERLLPIPKKKFQMAVVGAGLAGLTAAWDLARKSYPVTIVVQSDLKDTLKKSYPLLANEGSDILDSDLNALLRRDIQVVQSEVSLELVFELAKTHAAVLLDVDAQKDLAPQRTEVDDLTIWRDNICCAGWPNQTATGHEYVSAASQAGEGRRAAQTMERLATGTSLTAERNKVSGKLHTDLSFLTREERIEPKSPAGIYTIDEAKLEALRCINCECMICVRQCAYMQRYGSYPRVYARQVHNNAAIVKGLHTANALINGCALCDQCTELCPENFSMAELCLAAREDMVANGLMPPSAHEFALEDMEQAQGPESFLVLPDPTTTNPAWVFFPGCQLTASRGEQVLKLYTWLRTAFAETKDHGVALLLACCGEPAHWAGRPKLFQAEQAKLLAAWEELNKPVLLTACASCMAALKRGLPMIPVRSVWEVLDTMDLTALLEEKTDIPKVLSIHDPCAARHAETFLSSVRSLAKKAGVTLIEPEKTAQTTACCGYGGLVWCAQPETAKAMTEKRAQELSGPTLASCIMCRDRLVASGKECWYILDLLFKPNAGSRDKGPGLGLRRSNRAKLKRQLLGLDSNKPKSKLILSDKLIEELEAQHILLQDLEEAVAEIEAKQLWFLSKTDGHRIGSWRPRKVTFWVEYSLKDDCFVVHDAWCHRMIVPGSGGQEADDVIAAQQCCTDGGRRERQ